MISRLVGRLIGTITSALIGYCMGYMFMNLKLMNDEIRAFRKQVEKELAKLEKLERHDKHLG